MSAADLGQRRVQRRIQLPGVALSVDDWGPEDAPAVLCLHGFPELGRYWHPLARHLPQYRWLMPDLRGCGHSDRPAQPDDYGIEALRGDVAALLDVLQLRRVHLLGHDWGGMLAWFVALAGHPAVQTLAVSNAPHPAAFQERLLHDPQQRQASAYLSRLQMPGAGAVLLADGPAAFWDRLRGVHVADFDADDRAAWIAAWSRPDALDGACAWYRCAPLTLPVEGAALPTWHHPLPAQLALPTLILWGEADGTFVPALATESLQRCRDARLVTLPRAHHNPIRSERATCAHALDEFWTARRDG